MFKKHRESNSGKIPSHKYGKAFIEVIKNK